MPSIIRTIWWWLRDVARLARRGEDALRRQPPWDFPSHRRPDEQLSRNAVSSAEDDKRKNLDHLDADVGRLESMDGHEGLFKGLLVGSVLGIVSCSLFRHYVLHDTATLTASFLSAANGGIAGGTIVPLLLIRVLARR
jgi:hypothetical protein